MPPGNVKRLRKEASAEQLEMFLSGVEDHGAKMFALHLPKHEETIR